jgi:hypothetical protein
MPTSFPRWFPEVRFPYEFTALYDKPLAYFEDKPQGFQGAGVGAPFDGISENTVYHRYKHDEMLRGVQGKILSDVSRRIKQITGQSNRQVAHQKLEESGMLSGGVGSDAHSTGQIEGANVLAGRGRLNGGVMRSQAGKQYLQRRLTSRIQELNRIGDLSQGFPIAINRDVDYTEEDKAVMSVGEHLDAIVDVVNESAKLGSDSVKDSRGYVSALKEIGWRFPQNALTVMIREVGVAINALNGYMNSGKGQAFRAESNLNAKVILNNLKKGLKLLEYLTTKSTLSPKERKMALASYTHTGKTRSTKEREEFEGAGKKGKEEKKFAPTETVYNQKFPSWYVAPNRKKVNLKKPNPSGLE